MKFLEVIFHLDFFLKFFLEQLDKLRLKEDLMKSNQDLDD